MRQSVIVYLALLGGCSLGVRCGSPKVAIVRQDAENNIAAGLRAQGWNVTAIHCDTDGVPPEVGSTFLCQVELDGKKTYGFRATITKRTGDVFQSNTKPVDPRAVDDPELDKTLAATLAPNFGEVTVDCREPMPSLPADNILPCDASFSGHLHVIEVHYDAPGGKPTISLAGLVPVTQLAALVAARYPGAKVDCGDDPLLDANGGTCTITGVEGGGKAVLERTVDGFKWSLQP